jgi:phage terminase large subunit GpA-like protein
VSVETQVSNSFLEELESARREEVFREAARADKMAEIANYRWLIAQKAHRLANGAPLDFDKYPYQREIYQDTALEQVVMGSVQWGKSEFLIASSAAMAAIGLNVFFVISKYDKRDRFVSSRITPSFREVPLYRKMLEAAKLRNADTDSSRFKHFGMGSINFVGSNSDKDFTSYQADAAIVDEHQECVSSNVSRIDSRMSGSPHRFKIIVGNPRITGTEENSNLDWEYKNTDRRQWHVPCEFCKRMQVLGWWTNFVKEERNRTGAITSVSPLDTEYSTGDRLDMRPVCIECRRPMNRLSRKGRWVQTNPGHLRHGFQLSNLYNVNVRMDKLYAMYRAGLASPIKMADFVNDQLGLAWNMEGSSISQQMLEACSRGDACGLQPYRMIPASQLEWAEAA